MRVAILHVFPELYGNVCKIVFASKNTPYVKYVNQFCLSYKTQNATASGGEIRKCAEQFSTQEIIFKNLPGNFHTKFDRSNFFQIENAELLFSLKYHESNCSIFLR